MGMKKSKVVGISLLAASLLLFLFVLRIDALDHIHPVLTARAGTNEPPPCEILQDAKRLVCERLLTNFALEYEANVIDEHAGASCKQGCKLFIFDKRTPGRKLVQRIDDIAKVDREYPDFYRIDINFDGHEDIGYITDCGYQCANAFLIYDPEKGLFFDSGFDHAMFGDMMLDEEAKTINVITAFGNPGEFAEYLYAVEDNTLRLLEKYAHGEASTDEDFFRQRIENFVLDKTFSSVGLKGNFTLDVHIDLRNEGEQSLNTVGYVRYKGHKKRMALKNRFWQIVERAESKDGDWGAVIATKYSFDEVDQGKVTGVYSFIERNGEINEGYYIRWKDKKRFELKAKR
jgi:hypothetical protein